MPGALVVFVWGCMEKILPCLLARPLWFARTGADFEPGKLAGQTRHLPGWEPAWMLDSLGLARHGRQRSALLCLAARGLNTPNSLEVGPCPVGLYCIRVVITEGLHAAGNFAL